VVAETSRSSEVRLLGEIRNGASRRAPARRGYFRAARHRRAARGLRVTEDQIELMNSEVTEHRALFLVATIPIGIEDDPKPVASAK